MLPELLPGHPLNDGLADQLSRLAIGASNARTNAAGGPMLDAYVRFANEATLQLVDVVTATTLQRLLLTDTYWRCLSVLNLTYANDIASRELQAAQARLEQAAHAVRVFLAAWPMTDYAIVPDTNVLLHGTEGTIRDAAWHQLSGVAANENLLILLLPTVVEELDKHKSSNNRDVRSQARRALREIDAALLESGGRPVEISPGATPEGGAIYLAMAVEPADHVRLPDNDGEIIDRTLAAETRLARSVLFITGDTGAAVRASALAVTVIKIPTPNAD